MKNQLKLLGLSINWEHEISTLQEYYKHQQSLLLIFIKMVWYPEKKLMLIGILLRNSAC